MGDDAVDLKRLAMEAASQTYSPRAKRCFFWSHQWTMWEYSNYLKLDQRRNCVRCGLIKERRVWRMW